MDRDRGKMVERILHLTLEILFRLTGEDYTVVKKTSSERCQAPVSEGWGRPQRPITGPPPLTLIHGDINDQKILELTYKMIKLLTGEVPIRCQDVTIHFSMEEWEYLQGHKDLYKDVMMEVPQPLTSPDLSSKRITPERCPRPLFPQDSKPENPNVPQDHQVDTILNPFSGNLLYKRITRMDRNRDKMAERILHLTLEILFRLTGEDYTVVKKTSSERCQDPVSEGWGRPLSPITGPPPHPLIHEDINDQKILELTYKMIELLTGEVPIRCQDVAIYFSMEEWEYLEGHKDLYKDIMMEVSQLLTSQDPSSKRTTPERCPHPLLLVDCKQEDPDVPQDDQGEDLPHINTTETYVRDDERCKEEIPTDYHTDDCTRSAEGHLIFSDFAADSTPDTWEKTVIFVDAPQDRLKKNLSSDPFQEILSTASLKTNMQIESQKSSVKNDKAYIGEKSFSCSECGKYYTSKSSLVIHQRSHTGEKPYSCSECEKCFTEKSYLVKHQRIHTGEKPFLCSECGKCFNWKASLVTHLRIHTGEKPFSCLECGKRFRVKAKLEDHQRIHTGEKPFFCSECGKYFNLKTTLVTHLRSHTGDNPFSCSECGKRYRMKANLEIHQRIHTGEKPFSCSKCGKSFKRQSVLTLHEKIHTGKKPFSCSECGKYYSSKSSLVTHQRSHTGEKPYSCSNCGKCFHWKACLDKHLRIHTGEKPFSCSECGKCFRLKARLIIHQRSHTGEKPFSCSECGKCYTTRTILVTHQRSHTGEKPFSCSECGKCYSVKHKLKIHQRTHTGK
ncbi:uncharacterized protein [Phyllobates terribilis]|uniref:uncharacterized protein isoform X3 n=2 Tax=Phyllobates terribilis TaxID=111132 RepID=UPI003CCAAD97